jgi:hypothetical protein
VNSGTGTLSSDSSMNGISIFNNKNANQYDNHNQEAWTCTCFGDMWILTGAPGNPSIPIRFLRSGSRWLFSSHFLR